MKSGTLSVLLAASLILAACSSTPATTNPPPPPPAPPPPPPPPPPPAAQHLYVAQGNIPGALLVYNLPLTASSAPIVTVPYNAGGSLASNATTLVVNRGTDYTVSFFHLPLTAASTPYATLSPGVIETPFFLPNGSLYLAVFNTIHVYTPPFTSASTPTGQVVTTNLVAEQMTIDPNGTIYFPSGNKIGVISGGALTTTLTATPGTEFDAVAASATQLFACEGTGFASHVYVYTLPLTATATPVVTMNSGTIGISNCALDATGNLYLTWGPSIVVFAPPFTNATTAALTLPVSGSGAGGMVIGP